MPADQLRGPLGIAEMSGQVATWGSRRCSTFVALSRSHRLHQPVPDPRAGRWPPFVLRDRGDPAGAAERARARDQLQNWAGPGLLLFVLHRHRRASFTVGVSRTPPGPGALAAMSEGTKIRRRCGLAPRAPLPFPQPQRARRALARWSVQQPRSLLSVAMGGLAKSDNIVAGTVFAGGWRIIATFKVAEEPLKLMAASTSFGLLAGTKSRGTALA